MTKRGAKRERSPRDFYPTPEKAVRPLLAVLDPHTLYLEPCAGDGALVRILDAAGHCCMEAWDIEPKADFVLARDGAALTAEMIEDADPQAVITNPPFERATLMRLMDTWLSMPTTTWLLLPLDYLANQWFAPYAELLWQVVPIGRVKWFPDSKHSSTENFAWMRFERTPREDDVTFLVPPTGGPSTST